jgi:hypothetical protein
MGIAERRYQRQTAGVGVNRTPYSAPAQVVERDAKTLPREAVKPREDDRARIGYVSIGGKLRSLPILEDDGTTVEVEGRKARGTRKPRMVSRAESRKRNQIGRKKAGAYADAADRQYGGFDTARIMAADNDALASEIAAIMGRSPNRSELSDLRRGRDRMGAEWMIDKALSWRR